MHSGGEAIVTNTAEFLVATGAAGGGERRDDAEIRWTVGGSPIDYHNAVVDCFATDVVRAAELAGEFVDTLARFDVPGSWHHHPGMTPPGLLDVLAEVGFTDGGSEPAMARSLDDLPATPHPAELVIRSVRDATALGDYRDVLADGFGEGPREADWVHSIWTRIGLSTHSPWRHYVATVDGEPVSTATVFRAGASAGLYFVATRPPFRRRGYGAAITASALDRARAEGATVAVLGSSPMGQSIYEQLGFQEHFTYRVLAWEPTTC